MRLHAPLCSARSRIASSLRVVTWRNAALPATTPSPPRLRSGALLRPLPHPRPAGRPVIRVRPRHRVRWLPLAGLAGDDVRRVEAPRGGVHAGAGQTAGGAARGAKVSVLTLWGGEYMPGRRVMGLKALVWLVNDLRERKVHVSLLMRIQLSGAS